MARAYYRITPLQEARILDAPPFTANLDFRRGAMLAADAGAEWVFGVDIEGTQPPHLLGGPIPMASEQLLKVLTAAGVDNLQAFPAVLRLAGGGAWRQHSVLNVIGLVDAADLAASDGAVLAEGDRGPTLVDFKTLQLSSAQARGLPVFRLFHDPAALLVNDRILEALDRQRPPEGWGFSTVEIQVTDV
jgi:hypothetical protein